MSDSDPRPMPAEVLRAYRDPMDLVGLLVTDVYSEQDRRDVLDALVRSLVARYGDVWIAAGSKEVRVSTRVKAFKKNATRAIDLLRSIEEYGRREGVDALLAQAMEPIWLRWWELFPWRRWDDVNEWRNIARRVLGPRQFAWLAAQYARTAIERTRPEDRGVASEAIEAAEAWARVPSEENRKAARVAADAADAAVDNAADASAANAANAAASAAYTAAAAAYTSAYATADANAAYAADAAAVNRAATAYPRLEDLTKRLITPTLITHASRGLRASGNVTSQVVPAILGVAAGAGAVFLAKRA